jgi:uncharacterized membrane protein
MKTLKQISKLQLQQLPNKFAIAILLIALVGFADASYLTLEHFRGVIPPCTTDGCETVLTSAYSVVAGIPVALGGAIYYLLIAIGMFAYLDSKNTKILKWTLIATVLGLFCSVWFVFVQLFLVKAICQYCMLSAVTSTALFVLACVVFKKYKKINEQSEYPNN